MECFFVFVEGPDDERFITSVLGNDKIKVIKYAREKKEYINRYIKSIKSIPNYDYIVICDIDLKSLVEKKNAILAQFPDCVVEKIIVSIAEIESWYIAGVDEITSKAMKIKYVYCNGVQREHNKKLNNGLPILHKVPPKRDYGRYFCIMAEKGGTSHGGLTEKLSLFFHAKKQEVNAYGR